MFNVLSFLCYVFAVVDLGLFYIFDIDITGFSFSPIVAGALGALFSYLGGDNSEEASE